MHTRAAVAVLDAEASNKIVTAKVASDRSMRRPSIRDFRTRKKIRQPPCGRPLIPTPAFGEIGVGPIADSGTQPLTWSCVGVFARGDLLSPHIPVF
jgi:hypothetical protein